MKRMPALLAIVALAAVVWIVLGAPTPWGADRGADAPSAGHTLATPSESGIGIPSLPDDAFALTVDHVFDGDTIRARVSTQNDIVTTGTDIRIRLIGIDTPEGTPAVQCWADEARAHLNELLPRGSIAWATVDREVRDRYDRYLFYLWNDDGVFVNHALVAAGDAVAIRIAPNDAHYALLSAAQAEAEGAGAGQWGAC